MSKTHRRTWVLLNPLGNPVGRFFSKEGALLARAAREDAKGCKIARQLSRQTPLTIVG